MSDPIEVEALRKQKEAADQIVITMTGQLIMAADQVEDKRLQKLADLALSFVMDSGAVRTMLKQNAEQVSRQQADAAIDRAMPSQIAAGITERRTNNELATAINKLVERMEK